MMDELILRAGPEVVAIPGPSIIPERVRREFSRPMVDIYTGELLEITDAVFEALPRLAGSSGQPFVSISNGHGAWEMAITNTLSRGDRVLVLNSGIFAAVWGEMAAFLGIEVTQLDAEPGTAIDPALVEEALRSDRDRDIAAVLTVQADTASSARNDVAGIRAAIDAAEHPALLMVDAIASFGCEAFEMDRWGVDVMVAASQKGIMTPPGLGFNIVSDRALEVHRQAGLRSHYWDWTSRLDDSMHYLRYAGTPPVSHLFALREALAMIDEEGLNARYRRHAALAAAVHAAVEAWSASVAIGLHVTRSEQRAVSVTTIDCPGVDADELRSICRDQLGVTLGVGLRSAVGSSFRIGHMGHTNAPTVLGTIAAIEAALGRMGISITRSGVAAASAALA